MQKAKNKNKHVSYLLTRVQAGNKQAANEIEQLVRKHPDDAELLNAMGCIALEKGDFEKALEAFSQSQKNGYSNRLEQSRNKLIAYAMQGDVEQFDHHWNEIKTKLKEKNHQITLLRACIRGAEVKKHSILVQHCLSIWTAIDPDDYRLNLTAVSVALIRKNKTEALEYFKCMPAIPSEDIDALIKAAELCFKLKHSMAIKYFEKAIECEFTDAGKLQRLIALGINMTQLEKTSTLINRLLKHHKDLAVTKLYDRINVAQQLTDWATVEQLLPSYLDVVRKAELKPSGLFRHLSLPGLTDADHLMLANAFVNALPPSKYSIQAQTLIRKPKKGRRLRIGFLSADFKNHPVTQLIVQVLESMDKKRFELVGFDIAEDHESYWRQRILATFDEVVPVGELKELEFVEKLRSVKLDVLIELQGDTTDTKVWWLRHRVAPVQVSWLGFIGSIGHGTTDYILADRHIIPRQSRQYFAEKVIWMPDLSFPADTQRQAPKAPPRIVADLPTDAVVYCSFNAHYKITRETFEAWVNIVLSFERAVLWLFDQNSDSTARLKKAATELGLEPHRLIFAERKSHTEHMARLQLADVALDSWPYNSGATAIDTLWCGVPLVTKSDATMMSRVAGGMLHTLGLGELATPTVDEFIRVAIELGQDSGRRQSIKTKLIKARIDSPLYQPKRFAIHLERVCEMVFDRFEKGLAPEHIEVPAIEPKICSTDERVNDHVSTISEETQEALQGNTVLRSTLSYQVMLERGEYFLKQEKLADAQQMFEQVLNVQPEEPAAHYGLGMIFGLQGQYEPALQKMRFALNKAPDNARFKAHLEIMEKKAQSQHITKLQSLLSQGKKAHQEKKFEQACEYYQQALDKSPKHPTVLHYYGLAQVQMGNHEGLSKMKTALEIQPHNEIFLKNFNRVKFYE